MGGKSRTRFMKWDFESQIEKYGEAKKLLVIWIDKVKEHISIMGWECTKF